MKTVKKEGVYSDRFSNVFLNKFKNKPNEIQVCDEKFYSTYGISAIDEDFKDFNKNSGYCGGLELLIDEQALNLFYELHYISSKSSKYNHGDCNDYSSVDVKSFSSKIFNGSFDDSQKYKTACRCIDHYSDIPLVSGGIEKQINECSDAKELVEVWIGNYYTNLKEKERYELIQYIGEKVKDKNKRISILGNLCVYFVQNGDKNKSQVNSFNDINMTKHESKNKNSDMRSYK